MLSLSVFDDDQSIGWPGTTPTLQGQSGGIIAANLGPYSSGGSINVSGSAAGQIHNSLREVKVELTGHFAAISMWFRDERGSIESILRGKRWPVTRVAEISSGTLGVGNRVWHITVNVRASFSDQQVQNGIRSDLEGEMTVANVRLIQTSLATYVPGSADVPDPNGLSGLSVFLSSLGLGAGLSTPVVIAVGGLLLILLLKR